MVQHKYNVAVGQKPSSIAVRPVSLTQLRSQLNTSDLEAARQAGYQAGLLEAHQGAAKALDAAVDRLDKSRQEALDALSTSTVELAVEIARQIVRVEIQAENYDLERIVRGALSQSGLGRGEATIHVCPADHKRLSEVTFRSGTEVAIDSTLEPGDVHVQAAQGLLVREVSECLASVREQLLEDLA
ncbi:MAG: FliH/SctL family protein [Planctomycetota bacterium]|nr:FliH/SctL family protein [Planctomycetota bacterium]